MRPIWTGAIGFGLVNIPVKMYSATQGSELDLDMLDKKDHARIRYMRINEKSGKEVPWENIVKGFRQDDKYIVLTKKDFENAAAEKTKTIHITDFVSEKEIDPMYYETPYFLEPEKNGMRAYALLREALSKTGKAGIATFVMRSKETLAALRVHENAIVLNRLRFHQELRDVAELKLPEKKAIKPAELKMAISLISQLSGEFDISQYKDTYTAQLTKLIKAKARGVKVKEPKLKLVHSKAKDLMDQLKESLKTRHKKAS